MNKVVVLSISKQNISKLDYIIDYCNQNDINELILLLFGEIYGKNSIVEKEGLIQLVDHLPNDLNIKIVREGLGYTLSAKDYQEIFNHTSYQIVNTYDLILNKYTLHFESNNLEDHMWNDEYFSELLTQANHSNHIKICAVYMPTENDYLSDWGKSAWRLSKRMDSSLLYLDDGDCVEIVEDDHLEVYSFDERLNKIKMKELK